MSVWNGCGRGQVLWAVGRDCRRDAEASWQDRDETGVGNPRQTGLHQFPDGRLCHHIVMYLWLTTGGCFLLKKGRMLDRGRGEPLSPRFRSWLAQLYGEGPLASAPQST